MNDFDNNKNNDNNVEDYEFVTETTKRRPINKRKVLKKLLFTIVLAIIFGLVATGTLVIVYPRLYERLYPNADTKKVSLPVAIEENVAEEEEEFVPPQEDIEPEEDINTDGVTQSEVNKVEGTDAPESESTDGKADDSEDKGEDETLPDNSEDKNVVINQVVETVEKNLEIEDYRLLLKKIAAISTSTQKSLVTVSGSKSNTDWFNNSYDDYDSSIGVILAENGKDLLIITPTDILSYATNVLVTFNNGETCQANIKATDANTGLGVIAVPLDKISEEVMEGIEMAEFGGLATQASGTPVVAVGAPFGVAGSMAMGQITTNSIVIDKCDSDVRLISTDIYGSTKATGVLVNYNGRIIGIICHDDTTNDMLNLIRAYSVEDIMVYIEKMSNGSKLACFGIKGTDVTKEANENYNVPMGAYVKEVIVDSPAMITGIRNGDVITRIGLEEVKSYKDFKRIMLESRPGDTYAITLYRPSGSDYIAINYEITMEELK